MNDDEVIKEATEAYNQNLGAGCYVGDLLAIINRQKAELERLQKECEITRAYIHNNGLEWGLVSHLEFYKNQRAEAIKEFAEKLKELKYQSSDWSHGGHPQVVEESDIDDLLEELTNRKE